MFGLTQSSLQPHHRNHQAQSRNLWARARKDPHNYTCKNHTAVLTTRDGRTAQLNTYLRTARSPTAVRIAQLTGGNIPKTTNVQYKHTY